MNNLHFQENRLPGQDNSSKGKSCDLFSAANEVVHYINVLKAFGGPGFTDRYGQSAIALQKAYIRDKEDRLDLSKTGAYARIVMGTGQAIFDDETVWQAIKPEGGTIRNFKYTKDELKAYMRESIENTRSLIEELV